MLSLHLATKVCLSATIDHFATIGHSVSVTTIGLYISDDNLWQWRPVVTHCSASFQVGFLFFFSTCKIQIMFLDCRSVVMHLSTLFGDDRDDDRLAFLGRLCPIYIILYLVKPVHVLWFGLIWIDVFRDYCRVIHDYCSWICVTVALDTWTWLICW